MNKEYLFVYGTLRRDFGLALMQEIAEDIMYIGLGEIDAVLYDLGNYPGAVKALSQSQTRGEIFEIRNGEKTFTQLDEYEGEEYGREKAKVRTDEGEELDAWVYWYTGRVDETQRIHDRDYLLYLKNKKERLA